MRHLLKKHSSEVVLRGTQVRATTPDMPTILAMPDLLQRPETLRPLFNSRLYQIRNVWFLSYRNSWLSDRHPSMDPQDLANDVMRFMDSHKITTASIVGHGFGARIATITGILKYHRITSVVGLDYAPQDYSKHFAWKELKEAVELAASFDLQKQTKQEIEKEIRGKMENQRLMKTVLGNLEEVEGELYWNSGMKELANCMNLRSQEQNIGKFPLVGIYPGRAMFLYAQRGEWVHQSSNTIPIYNLFPILLNTYGDFIDHIDTDNHWLHETEHVRNISRRIFNFYRWYDGVHPLLADRSEIGKVSLPIRHRSYVDKEHLDEVGDPLRPKAIPLHTHHNWSYVEESERVQIPQFSKNGNL